MRFFSVVNSTDLVFFCKTSCVLNRSAFASGVEFDKVFVPVRAEGNVDKHSGRRKESDLCCLCFYVHIYIYNTSLASLFGLPSMLAVSVLLFLLLHLF